MFKAKNLRLCRCRWLVRGLILVFILLLLSVQLRPLPGQTQAKSLPAKTLDSSFVKGEVLVITAGSLTQRRAADFVHKTNYQLKAKPFLIGSRAILLRLQTKDGEEEKALQNLRQNSQVLAADLNYQRSIPEYKTSSKHSLLAVVTDFWPNDPLLADGQWNLHTNHANFTTAWEQATGDNVVIAILDTGVWPKHPDLFAKIAPGGYNFVADNAYPYDNNGHGTWSAGIAGAATNNGTGIAGAGFNAQILPVKVLDYQGTGSDYDIIRGIFHATMQDRVKVINMSFAGPAYSEALEYAVNYAFNLQGKTLVAAVGYADEGVVTYPAGYANVLAATNVGYYNEHGDRSTTGAWLIGHAVSAPGIEVWTTNWQADILPKDYFIKATGNSLATPHVAALAALLASQGKPNWWIVNAILQTARPLGDKSVFGEGLIDAGAAVQVVISPPSQDNFFLYLPLIKR